MKRYNLTLKEVDLEPPANYQRRIGIQPNAVEDPEGEWVKHSDHKTELRELLWTARLLAYEECAKLILSDPNADSIPRAADCIRHAIKELQKP